MLAPRCLTAVLLAATLLAAAPARASSPSPLTYNAGIEVPVLVLGAVGWLGSELLFKHALAPGACRWCAVDAVDATVRDDLVWSHPATADLLSNVSGFVLVPLATLGGIALSGAVDRQAQQIPAEPIPGGW